ncbi:uncharacterized protein [Miscanthus floridulus]|uniref:uncharacterized protein n=1 Tax=Miscanthus floridulus TaxID=154761 RepID=UPI003457A4BD
MAAYCREVYQLEDKFNGLKLNHIPRRLNEAADALEKVASDQELVPIGVFASDQHKPSVRYKGLEQDGDGLPVLGSGADQPLAPSSPKVMELEEDPAIEPDPLVDWSMPYLDYLLYDTLSTNKMEARWLTHHAKSFVLVESELYK